MGVPARGSSRAAQRKGAHVSLGIVLGGLLMAAALGLASVIAFGGPTPPPPLVSIRDAVLKRDHEGPC